MRSVLLFFGLITVLSSGVAHGVESSFIKCSGKMSQSSADGSSTYQGIISVIPYQKEGGLAGVVDWKAVISGKDGKFEIMPLVVTYSLARQTITLTYDGAEGNLEMGIGLAKADRIHGNHQGSFGLSLNSVEATVLNALRMECVLSKSLVD